MKSAYCHHPSLQKLSIAYTQTKIWGDCKKFYFSKKFFSRFFSEHTERERADKWNDLIIQSQSLFKRLAEYASLSPALPKVQDLVQEWKD